MILGLDISTSIIGATVLDKNGEVVYCEAWDLRNKNTIQLSSKKHKDFNHNLRAYIS